MPTRKIADLPEPHEGWHLKWKCPCAHPEHNPPSMMVLPPGIYEHECPGCGHKTVFTVPRDKTIFTVPYVRCWRTEDESEADKQRRWADIMAGPGY